MNASENVTIPIHSTTSGSLDSKNAPTTRKRWTWRIPRFVKVTSYIGLLSVIGWTGWRCLAPSSRSETPEVVAEFEGFLSAPVFTHVPKPDDTAESDSVNMSAPIGLPLESTIATNSPAQGEAVSVPVNSVNVWLTGTIEDSDSTSTMDYSLRISGTPNDSSTVR